MFRINVPHTGPRLSRRVSPNQRAHRSIQKCSVTGDPFTGQIDVFAMFQDGLLARPDRTGPWKVICKTNSVARGRTLSESH